MTTIFVDNDNKRIYADTKITWGDNSFEEEKVFKHEGMLIALSGNLNYGSLIKDSFLEYYEENKDDFNEIKLKEFFKRLNIEELFTEKEKEGLDESVFEIIILNKDDMFLIDSSFKISKVLSNICIGSGCMYSKLLFNTITSKNGEASFYSKKMSKIKQQKFDEIFIKYLSNIESVDKYTNSKFHVYSI